MLEKNFTLRPVKSQNSEEKIWVILSIRYNLSLTSSSRFFLLLFESAHEISIRFIIHMFASLPSPVFFEIFVKSLLRILNRFFITGVNYNTGYFQAMVFCEGLLCYRWVILHDFLFQNDPCKYFLQPPYRVRCLKPKDIVMLLWYISCFNAYVVFSPIFIFS